MVLSYRFRTITNYLVLGIFNQSDFTEYLQSNIPNIGNISGNVDYIFNNDITSETDVQFRNALNNYSNAMTAPENWIPENKIYENGISITYLEY